MNRVMCLSVVSLMVLAGGPEAAANDVDGTIFRRGSTSWGAAYKGRWYRYSVKVEGSKWIKAVPAYDVWLKNYSNTTAQRITLPSSELALKWAATKRFKSPRLVEVRGNQVVWINGVSNATVRNAARVERMLSDAWSETSTRHPSFRALPGPVLYRGQYGSTGTLLTYQRHYAVRFSLPANASAALRAWADKLLDDAWKAGATVEKRSDGHYRYTTHADLDTPAVAFPAPATGGGSLAGALSVTVVRRAPVKKAPAPADREEPELDE